MGGPKILKIVLLGDGSVGKTSLRRKYMGDTFKDNYQMTIGADFAIKRLGKHLIQIYDLAGQPGFKLLRRNYYHGAQAAVVVFDVTKPKSLENVPLWIQEMNMAQGFDVPVMLVGNKIDLRDPTINGIITTEIGKNHAEMLRDALTEKVFYYETSAKTGERVEEMFNELLEYLTET